MSVHRFVEPGHDRIESTGGPASAPDLLHYPDGTIRVMHVCKSWPDPKEPDGEFVKVIAPALSPGHQVTFGPARRTTVSPSILCADCGLHGYVTDGIWRSA